MSSAGSYLYGFTDRSFRAAAEWRGLGGAPLQEVTYREVSAIVSRHPVQRLAPSRSNLEPHHRIVRHISTVATLVPAAFGHISETDDDLLAVLRENYDEIRQEIAHLDRKCEMTVKLRWSVDNIFLYFVQRDRGLRELRDRAFRGRQPSMSEKLAIGERFDALLTRERDHCTSVLMATMTGVAKEMTSAPARGEKTVCEIAALVDRTSIAEFEAAVRRVAAQFDHHFSLEYSGPWPAYSFVRLRLQHERPATA